MFFFIGRARALDGASHPGGDPMNPVCIRIAGAVAFAFISAVASAADYPAPKEGDWGARGFCFHTLGGMPQPRLPFRKLGKPSARAVLFLPGRRGPGATFLAPHVRGEVV